METPLERQIRITNLVMEKWPKPLSPNKLINTIIDIVRGKHFVEDDIVEAVDAISLLHLPISLDWDKKINKG